MISNEVSTTATVRNVFIIDTEGIVRAILVYPMQVGRYISEIIRLVTALQTADNNNAMTPANWTEGEPLINPPPQTFLELQERVESINNQNNGMSWYLSFKNPK